jgi:uncharacterized protein YfaS (alpha-2-macroglobulin family)
MRRAWLGLTLFLGLGSAVLSQSAELRVVSSGPSGEIGQLQDANEIRLIFSEPMVALGRIPSNPDVPWVRIEPAIRGAFRWSGTTILIFTPDPATALPYATKYTVTVEAGAASASGRRIGQPYSFSFTTPTVRLRSARWMRQGNRFDAPVALALQFNQPVRAADVIAHLGVRYEPHPWDPPAFTPDERARLAASDPAGLKRFDAKVALARQVAARSDALPLRAAADWDRRRFPPSDQMVVLETVTVPPPGAWLRLTVGTDMPSPQGPERPSSTQSSLVELPALFFVQGIECRAGCAPSDYNPIIFSEQVAAARFADALTATDITDAPREQAVPRTSRPREGFRDISAYHSVEDGRLDRQPPARTWALRLDPALEATDGQTLGYPWIGIVENWHERAFTSFGGGHGVWERGGGSTLPFYARNFRTVTEHLQRLVKSDLMPRILTLESVGFEGVPSGPGRLRTLAVRPDEIQSHGVDLSGHQQTPGPGLFWAAMVPGEAIPRSQVIAEPRSSVVQVTNLGISVKDSPQNTLIFVTRLDNAEPVPGAAVTVIDTGSKELWRGLTDRQGLAMAPALPLRSPDNWYRLSYLVTAEKDDDLAYAASNWNEGIVAWNFGYPYDLWQATDILRGSLFTDRGVYKPGEDVQFKAIIRADTAHGVRLLPSGTSLDLVIRDARNRDVDRRRVAVNRWSSAEWKWTVPAEAMLGSYSVQATLAGTEKPEGNDVTMRVRGGQWLRRVHGSFQVAAYRKPEFRVDTTLQADPALAGSTLRAAVTARYLFGNPLGGRPVRWSLDRSPDLTVPSAIVERFPRQDWAFGYYPQRGVSQTRVAGESAVLGAKGALTLDLPTERDVDVAFRYTFEGDVEDVSRQHLANRSSVVVAPAPWYIGLRRPSYFANIEKGASVDVITVGMDGAIVPGVSVTLALVRVQWNSIRRAEGSGFYSWETERLEIPSGEWTVTTSDTPQRVGIPLSEGGYYALHATARDREGRRTRTDVSFYAIGSGYTAWERFDHNRIKLEPERRTWKPGERARVMIQSPWESATGLLTVEREGIRHHERFTLTSTQQTVEVPITEADIPNVYVSVLLLRGRSSDDPGPRGEDPGKPAFRLGYTELAVADTSKALSVTVSADRDEYLPATRAKVSVLVRDSADRPAPSEVTLWAVDHGVLSLTDYRAPDVLRSVYQHKALQVMTVDSRQRIVSRRVVTPKGANPGGGGGSEGLFRRDFRPLAFWLGSVETDRGGRATSTVTLPETLTTYRIMAVAADTASRFGSGDAEIRVARPIVLMPALPRFLTLGDRASIGAVISNTLVKGGDATVTIRSLDPGVLEVTGVATLPLALEAAGTAPARFGAIARSVGTARVQMTVRLGGASDAFELPVPVVAPARIETSAAFGEAADRATEKLSLPAGVVPGTGGLTVELSSTALVGLGEGARYLTEYQYTCAEQKASAALALVLAADLGTAFAMGRIAPADYRARAAEHLRDLPRYQCADGGFGYWPGGCLFGDAYLTSYVLHVMHVARGHGFPPDAEVVNRALDFLQAAMQQPEPRQVQWLPGWSASLAFGAKVLTEYGRNQDSNITRLAMMADRLPVFALSYLADAMAASKSTGPRYRDIVRRIQNAIRVEGDRAHIEELDTDELRWLWNSNVRTTALTLQGFVQRADDPQFVAGLVRWLLLSRRNGRWSNTQENATALEALVAYYKKFEAETPNLAATVSLGRNTLGTPSFRGRSSATQAVRLAMPDLIRQVAAGAEADLTVGRAGTGRLYYATRLQFVTTTPAPPSDQGISVERRFERFVENGEAPLQETSTTFEAGDLVRVTVAVTLPKERRFLALTDPLAAGFEAIEGWFATTAADLRKDSSSQAADRSWETRWRRGGFDHVEKYDDRVQLFATRLSEGRHEFSYLVRATTSGTFTALGTYAEEMYAPEVNGRTGPATIVIR